MRTGKDCRELTAQELAEIRKELDHEGRAERDGEKLRKQEETTGQADTAGSHGRTTARP